MSALAMRRDTGMSNLDAEIKAFESMISKLEKHHNGKWVLFHEAEFIDAFDTFENAAQEAIRCYGKGPYLIRQVGAPPVTLPVSLAYRPVHADS